MKRSHQRVSGRGRSAAPERRRRQQRRRRRRHRDRQQHRGIMEGAAEMQQSGFCRRPEKAYAGHRRDHSSCRQAQHGGHRARRIVADALGQKSRHSRERDRRRGSQRRGVKQVLPAEAARPLAHIVDVECGPDRARSTRPTHRSRRVARCARAARSLCPWNEARMVSADATRGVYIALFSKAPR